MVSLNDAVNVILFSKGDERYVWIFNDANQNEVLRSLGRFAANDDLSLTWKDAATIRMSSDSLTNETP